MPPFLIKFRTKILTNIINIIVYSIYVCVTQLPPGMYTSVDPCWNTDSPGNEVKSRSKEKECTIHGWSQQLKT